MTQSSKQPGEITAQPKPDRRVASATRLIHEAFRNIFKVRVPLDDFFLDDDHRKANHHLVRAIIMFDMLCRRYPLKTRMHPVDELRKSKKN